MFFAESRKPATARHARPAFDKAGPSFGSGKFV